MPRRRRTPYSYGTTLRVRRTLATVPRRRTLSNDQIADAALAVLERDGLAALSMRSVARELGAGTMSLYRYVSGRDELDGLMLGRVLDGVDPEVPTAAPWDERIVTLARRFRQVGRGRPALVPLLLTRRAGNPTAARWAEAVMTALDDGGFAGADRVVAFRTIVSYLVGTVQFDHYGPLSGEGTRAIAALPPDRFPMLADTAAHAAAVSADDEFDRGLAAVLAGLAAVTERRRSGT